LGRELGALDQRAAASLAGLAPMTRQSGQCRGKAFIQGGRAVVREALYMPALVAARFTPDLKAVHDRIIAAGEPAKVATTAVMRKLLVIANVAARPAEMEPCAGLTNTDTLTERYCARGFRTQLGDAPLPDCDLTRAASMGSMSV
jgi:hypothetical protein